MVSLIHNPTQSFQLPLPTTSSNYTSSKPQPSITSSSFLFKHNTTPLFKTHNQRKQQLTFNSSTPFRRFSICAVTQIDHTQFQDTVLKSEVPVLVEFIADWCGPCRLIAPAIEWASQEYKDKLKIVKIDHDANPQLIEKYKVYGLPGLIVFYKGEAVGESRREGAMTKVKLKEYIDAVLDSISVA